jgi:ssDNA-binding Zn-finger/Zn-ribbon topoisomerase 1
VNKAEAKKMDNETQNRREDQSTVCPHCGYDIKIPGILISEEDKREYFRRMMSGEVFSKRYEYLGGDVVVELTELSTEKADRLVDVIRSVDDDQMVLIYAFRAKFLACCNFMKVGENILIDKAEEDLSDIVKMNEKYQKLVGKMGAVPASLADDSLKAFSTLIDGAIQAAVTSRDF